MNRDTLSLPGRTVAVHGHADVVVAGGGPSGFAAAVTAARRGLKVVLIERYGFLGGLATAGAVGTICGMNLYHPDRVEFIIEGFAKELADNLAARGGAFGPVSRPGFAVLLYNPWHMKRLCDEWVEREGKITLMLHSTVADVVISEGLIRALVMASPEGLYAVTGEVFIDATGDAVVSLAAGVETATGDARGAVMNPTMMFFTQGMDFGLYQQEGMEILNDRIEEAIQKGTYALTVSQGLVIPTFRPGEALVKLSSLAKEGRALNGSVVADITQAELLGRRDAEIVMTFLKNEIPGFKDAFLADTAVQVGIRETRRIVGRYVLTEDDVLAGRRFDDGICLCSWPLEIWEEGKAPRMVFLEEGRYYGIPYRSLLPREVGNLLVTGRAISMNHEALASARVMGPCFAEGQAAGIAADLAVKNKCRPPEIDIENLQSELKKDGARLE